MNQSLYITTVPTRFRNLQQMVVHISILLMAALAVIYAGICLYAYYVSDSIIFPPLQASYEDGPEKKTSS